MSDELKTIKFQMMLSPSESERIDDWGFGHRIRSRAEAIRRLCQIGMAAESQIRNAQKRTDRALKALNMVLEKADLPKKVQAGIATAMSEMVEAQKQLVAWQIAENILSDAGRIDLETNMEVSQQHIDAMLNTRGENP